MKKIKDRISLGIISGLIGTLQKEANLLLKDKTIIGIVIGLLANIVKLIINYIGFKLGFTSVVFWQLVAALLLDKKDIFSPIGILVGGIADLISATFLGVLFI